MAKRGLYTLLSLIAFCLIWWLVAALAESRMLPTPGAVASVFAAETRDGEMWRHVAITLARVAAAFAIAMIVGIAIGLGMGRLRRLDQAFDAWLVLGLNMPALVIIILAYVWFGLTEAAAIGAVAVNKIPTVVVTVREGARALERDYLELAQVYRFGPWRSFRHVVLPQLAPFVVAAARSGLSLIWKIVLVVELLGRSDGVGFQLGIFFQLFDVPSILAYALAFILVIQLLELGLIQPLERRVAAWRR